MGEALWDENWSGLFLFPLFYLSCHYVSSAVFNDGSSLQAVSGCTAVGGGGTLEARELFFVFFLMSLSSRGQRRAWQMPQIPTPVIMRGAHLLCSKSSDREEMGRLAKRDKCTEVHLHEHLHFMRPVAFGSGFYPKHSVCE